MTIEQVLADGESLGITYEYVGGAEPHQFKYKDQTWTRSQFLLGLLRNIIQGVRTGKIQ